MSATQPIAIDDSEIEEHFIRASGPGGQHVNKTESAVQLRFNVLRSPSLPDGLRLRLIRLAGKRITDEGVLIIHAQRFRSQAKNREDAMQRLMALIAKAAEPRTPRRPTRPSQASQRQRLARKRKHGETKRGRGPVSE